MIDYLYRMLDFPIICVIGDWLITAKSDPVLQNRIDKRNLEADTHYDVVDSIGNEWVLSSEGMYMRPTLRRKWSKKKIIQTYNQSHNCAQTGITYSEKSLSAKRFDRIFSDIVELIEQTQ